MYGEIENFKFFYLIKRGHLKKLGEFDIIWIGHKKFRLRDPTLGANKGIETDILRDLNAI